MIIILARAIIMMVMVVVMKMPSRKEMFSKSSRTYFQVPRGLGLLLILGAGGLVARNEFKDYQVADFQLSNV